MDTCERQQSYSVQMNKYRHMQIFLAIFATTCLKSYLDNLIVCDVAELPATGRMFLFELLT